MTFIDRRLNDKKKSLVNRKKFLDRSKVSIKESLKKALSSRKITDLDSKEKISINPKGINEPYLSHDTDGNRDFILPGNKTFDVGDELGKPTKEDGGDGKEGSEEGEGVDDFTFTLDKDEFLYLTGRKDYLINVSGEKVNPEEIEEVVKMLKPIEEVVAIGVEHKIFGKVIKLLVKKHEKENIDTLSIITHCKENLERYKVPIRVEFVSNFPKNEHGKIIRFMLQEKNNGSNKDDIKN